jgi:hypothetical protein
MWNETLLPFIKIQVSSWQSNQATNSLEQTSSEADITFRQEHNTAFHGTRNLVTLFTRRRPRYLVWAIWIHFKLSNPISLRSTSSHLCFGLAGFLFWPYVLPLNLAKILTTFLTVFSKKLMYAETPDLCSKLQISCSFPAARSFRRIVQCQSSCVTFYHKQIFLWRGIVSPFNHKLEDYPLSPVSLPSYLKAVSSTRKLMTRNVVVTVATLDVDCYKQVYLLLNILTDLLVLLIIHLKSHI